MSGQYQERKEYFKRFKRLVGSEDEDLEGIDPDDGVRTCERGNTNTREHARTHACTLSRTHAHTHRAVCCGPAAFKPFKVLFSFLILTRHLCICYYTIAILMKPEESYSARDTLYRLEEELINLEEHPGGH